MGSPSLSWWRWTCCESRLVHFLFLGTELISADFHMEESDLFLLLKEEGVLSPLLRKRNPLSFTLVEHPNNTKQNKGEMSGPRWTILRATGDEKSLDYLAGILRSRRAVSTL